jgi:hypothetical protein
VFYSKLHRHVAVSAALLIAASCSDGPGITGPGSPLSSTDASASAKDHRGRRHDVLKRASRLRNPVSATATITPDGGVLELPEAGLVLYFPAGALSRTTTISATALEGKRVVYDFQPHGLVFATPIYVAQSLAHTELNTARARAKRPYVWGGYLTNGERDILADDSAIFAETFDAYYSGTDNEARAVFTTTHFSGYAFGSGVIAAPKRSE